MSIIELPQCVNFTIMLSAKYIICRHYSNLLGAAILKGLPLVSVYTDNCAALASQLKIPLVL